MTDRQWDVCAPPYTAEDRRGRRNAQPARAKVFGHFKPKTLCLTFSNICFLLTSLTQPA